MQKLPLLKQKVADLYQQKSPGRADWADWLYENHVLVVAKYARELAEKYGANPDLSEAAALLHDIADSKMRRANPQHEAESLAMARQLMGECGFSPQEVQLTVEDAIRYHSCHNGERPQSQEGLVLATADALAHLKTDFYMFALHSIGKDLPLAEAKQWILKKLERDLNNKLQFSDERAAAEPDYQLLKTLFSR